LLFDSFMSPRKKAQVAFTSALVLLFVSGVAVYASMLQLLNSERWVSHTRQVQSDIGEAESATAHFGRARMDYIATGNESLMADFQAGLAETEQELQSLERDTRDNSDQQRLCEQLRAITEQRIAIAKRAIDLRRSNPSDSAGQDRLTRESIPLLNQTTAVTRLMRTQEEHLLQEREHQSSQFTTITFVVLAITVILAIAMLGLHYRLLRGELEARERAEHGLRTLSTRLMQVQDEERRKFSRELHDSLGQYLAALKMNFETLAAGHREDRRYLDCLNLLDQCITETRTISHLLHPPLLEIAGFSTAARWFIDGFSKRSGIQIAAEIPDIENRMPESVEIALFRVLQESLTNIHRHSQSHRAEVNLTVVHDLVELTVSDFGVGLPSSVLERYNSNGSSGVGLAAMRERIRDIGGEFHVESTSHGTTVLARIPLGEKKIRVTSTADHAS
jgi:signal transduction histidine kinase